MSEAKTKKVEQKRLRGRNMHDVVSQLVTEYNSSNGWAVVRVTPTILNFEVLLERSTAQDDSIDEKVKSEVPVAEGKTEEPATSKKTTVKKVATTKK